MAGFLSDIDADMLYCGLQHAMQGAAGGARFAIDGRDRALAGFRARQPPGWTRSREPTKHAEASAGSKSGDRSRPVAGGGTVSEFLLDEHRFTSHSECGPSEKSRGNHYA